jgi:dynein heavy chain
MIDPQSQANKYIKNLGRDFEIKVLKVNDAQLMRSLEMAIQVKGFPLIYIYISKI